MDSFFGSSLNSAAQTVSQVATPTSGQTVVATETSSNLLVWLNPAGSLAACTVQLPSDAGTRIGQTISIGSAKAVTLLTLSGATTIYNPLAALLPGDLFVMEKVAANTWCHRI